MLTLIEQQVQNAIAEIAKLDTESVLNRKLYARYIRLMENHAEFRKIVWGRIYAEIKEIPENHRFELTDSIVGQMVKIIEEEIEKKM